MTTKKSDTLDYLSLLLSWRRKIIINCLIICVLAAGISLMLPKMYKSSTTMLPPTSDGGDLGLSSLLGNLPLGGLGLGMGMMSEETNTFIAILSSRTIAENVINHFDLIKRYKSENMEEAIRTLNGRIEVKINDEGTVTFSALAKTPFLSTKKEVNDARFLARDMANYFILELDRVNRRLKTERAGNTRVFIEKRYNQNLDDLKLAEEKFQAFQKKYGVIALPEQMAATIQAAAELKAQIIAKEVEVGYLSNFVNKSHTKRIMAQTELDELRKKYSQYETGHNEQEEEIKHKSSDLFISLQDAPDLAIQYLRLFREVKLQETIMEFLLPQYEQAKIQEAKDTPTVQVLDPAKAPIKRKSPKRMIIVLVTGFFSFLLFCFAAYISLNLEKLKQTDSEKFNRIESMMADLKPSRWFKS